MSAAVTTDLEYSVTGLENGTEYCFEVASVYVEGTSATSYGACATPMGPFVIEPLTVNFPEINAGEYMEATAYFLNFDTLDIDFSIFASPVADLGVYPDLIAENFENDDIAQATVGNVFSDTTELGTLIIGWWDVGDSTSASSTYLSYPRPFGQGANEAFENFAFINDDANGDGFEFNTGDALLYSDLVDVPDLAFGPVYLLVDFFFPQPNGPCPDELIYSEEAWVSVTTDDGASWQVVDSSFSTGWNSWASYMYNLTPMLNGATSFRVGFFYDDCGGNWAYGVGVDNVKVKQGDDFTWLSISPYKGQTSYFGGLNDTVAVTIGAYSTYDGFDDSESAYITHGTNLSIMSINTGVVMSADSDILPGVFMLHQNYPNPFNPETLIQFDVPERSDLALSVYNLLGRKVKTLANDNFDAGSYSVKWNGLSDSGEMLSSGMYFYELHSSKFHSVKKMIFVK